jgi:hypothetical protein
VSAGEGAAAGADGFRVAVVLDPSLPPGLLANTAAVICIGLGAAVPSLAGVVLRDAAGRPVAVGSMRPVPVLRGDGAVLGALLERASPAPDGAAVVPFPRFSRAMHDFEEYRAALPRADLAAATLDGVGLAGPAAWVRSLTGSLPLLR